MISQARRTCCWDDRRLATVDVEACCFAKDSEAVLYGGDASLNIFNSQGEVVCLAFNVSPCRLNEHLYQHVHDKDEERGRKWAALFDPSADAYGGVSVVSEGG